MGDLGVLSPKFLEGVNGVWGLVSLCIALGFGEYLVREFRGHGFDRLRIEAAIPIFFYFSGSAGYHLTAWWFRHQYSEGFTILPAWVGYALLVSTGMLAAWAGFCILRVFLRGRWGEWGWAVPMAFVILAIGVTVAERLL